MTLIAPGRCRHCGCTEDNPCTLRTGEPCCWADSTRTTCNSTPCEIAEAARQAAIKAACIAARPKRMNSVDIHQLIMARGRGRRRRKGGTA